MAKRSVCNFFALLKDDTIKKINLVQNITSDIRNVFIDGSKNLLNKETEEILFNGDFNIDGDEILYVEMLLSEDIIEAKDNSIGLGILDLKKDDVKALFWVDKDIFYFQNFDKRKLLHNKNVIFFENTTYHKLTNDALIVDKIVNAIYKNGKFYFKSYANANKIFSLAAFFEAASDDTIEEFSNNETLLVDSNWLKNNSDTTIRKQIALIQKSEVLKSANTKKIKSFAKKFNLNIDLQDGKLVFPTNKKECKDILSFLNEQYYEGLISGKKFKTNSKRDVT